MNAGTNTERRCEICRQSAPKAELLYAYTANGFKRWFHKSHEGCKDLSQVGYMMSPEASSKIVADFEFNNKEGVEVRTYPVAQVAAVVREYLSWTEEDETEEIVNAEVEAISDIIAETGDEPRELTTDELIERDIKVMSLKDELKQTKRKYDALVKQHASLSQSLNPIELLGVAGELKQFDVGRIDIDKSKGNRQVAALLMVSDVHMYKTIEADKTNNRNAYSFDECQRRLQNITKRTITRLRNYKQDFNGLDKLVLWLGGDLLENYLRPSNRSENNGTPFEEVLDGLKEFKKMILHLRQELDFIEHIQVVCSDGNHGRAPESKKVSPSTRASESLEHMMYQLLKTSIDDSSIDFTINKSYFTYYSIYGHNFCFHHGDAIKSRGGVGGIYVPLGNFVKNTASNHPIQVDTHVLGHFHTYTTTKNYLVNGSVCGFDNTGEMFGHGYEEPKQQLQLIDSSYGLTINTPIFCK